MNTNITKTVALHCLLLKSFGQNNTVEETEKTSIFIVHKLKVKIVVSDKRKLTAYKKYVSLDTILHLLLRVTMEAGQLLRDSIKGEAERRLDDNLQAGNDNCHLGLVSSSPEDLSHGQYQRFFLKIVWWLQKMVSEKIGEGSKGWF